MARGGGGVRTGGTAGPEVRWLGMSNIVQPLLSPCFEHRVGEPHSTTQTLHGTAIYAYIWVVWRVKVGIYGSPMECLGYRNKDTARFQAMSAAITPRPKLRTNAPRTELGQLGPPPVPVTALELCDSWAGWA